MSPYQTTNKYFHNEKRSSGSVLRNPEYKLAISAKNVNYCRQLYEKVIKLLLIVVCTTYFLQLLYSVSYVINTK